MVVWGSNHVLIYVDLIFESICEIAPSALPMTSAMICFALVHIMQVKYKQLIYRIHIIYWSQTSWNQKEGGSQFWYSKTDYLYSELHCLCFMFPPSASGPLPSPLSPSQTPSCRCWGPHFFSGKVCSGCGLCISESLRYSRVLSYSVPLFRYPDVNSKCSHTMLQCYAVLVCLVNCSFVCHQGSIFSSRMLRV